MRISAEFFKKSCPAAVTPTDAIYRRVSPFFDRPKGEVRNLVGIDIWQEMEDSDYDPVSEPSGDIENVIRDCAGFVCVTAFMDAVPMLDLVLTDTGFGVVSNENVAPASSERVRALKEALAVRQGELHDRILRRLCGMDKWNTSEEAVCAFSVMFRTCAEVSAMTGKPPTLSELKAACPEIKRAELEIATVISDELMERLTEGTRTASLSEPEKKLRTLIRQYISLWLRSADRNGAVPAPHDLFCKFRSAILKFVEDNIDSFPAYAGSSRYKANHFERYENKKEDTCFFFV